MSNYVEFAVCIMGEVVWWTGEITRHHGIYYDIRRLGETSARYCTKSDMIRRKKDIHEKPYANPAID